MKKVLSLVLVAVLAIGMGMSGFATLGSYTVAKVSGFYGNYSLIDGYNYKDNTNQYTYNSNLRTVSLGTIFAQDKRTDYIDLVAEFFVGARNVAGTNIYVNNVWYYLNASNFASNRVFDPDYQGAMTPSSWENVELILIQALRTPIVERDASGTQVKIRSGINGVDWEDLTIAEARQKLYNMSMIRPNVVNIQRYDEWFDWYLANGLVSESASGNLNNVIWFYNADGTIATGDPTGNDLTTLRNLSSEEIRENNITVYTQIQEESSAVKEVNFLRGEGRIEIKWATRFVSVDKKDFLLTIALNFDGRRDDDNAVTFVGTMYNKELKIYASANSADISEGLIAIPVEFNSKIALYVGNGATIHTKLFKDKKYYCTTSRDPDEADDIVFRQYPDVDNVLTFYPVGVNNTGDYVTLSTDYDSYYVYDRDMNYLGRGNEQLAYSSKYYLANKRLDIATDEEPSDYETPAELPPSNPITGGDGQAANNVNSNPGTGR